MAVTLKEGLESGGAVATEAADKTTNVEVPAEAPPGSAASSGPFDIYSAIVGNLFPQLETLPSRQKGSGTVDLLELQARERRADGDRKKRLRKSKQEVERTAQEQQAAEEALSERLQSRVASSVINGARWRHEAGLSMRADRGNDRFFDIRRSMRRDWDLRDERARAERRAWENRIRDRDR